MSEVAMMWATAVYRGDDGKDYTDLALVVVTGLSGRPPRPVAWDLSERRPKRCDSWSNYVGIVQ